MAQKDFESLKEEIDAAVHPGGGPPLIMGADLNTVLTSLATEVVRAGEPVRIADYNAISSGLENQTANTGEPASHNFAVGDLVGQSGLGLFRCAHAFTLRYDLDVEFSNHHFPLNSPTYWTPIVLNNGGGNSGFVVLTDGNGNAHSLTVDTTATLRVDGQPVGTTTTTSLTLTDSQGGTHPVFVTQDGRLFIDGQPVVPSVVPSVSLLDPNSVTRTLTVTAAGTLLVDDQAVLPAATPSLSLIAPNYTTHNLTVNEAGGLLVDGRPVMPSAVPSLSLLNGTGGVRILTATDLDGLLIDGQSVLPSYVPSLSLIDSNYTTHTLTVSENSSLVIDGRPATTPLISYTLTGLGNANENRQVPLTKILDYQQPGNLPDPELRDGGFVVPVRGYYELTSQATLAPNSMSTSQSCGVSGGPVFDWRNIGWVSGAPVARSLVARTSQRIMLEAGTVVYLFAQFAGPSVSVDGQLNVYLLHAA